MVRVGSGAVEAPVTFQLERGREAILNLPPWARYVLGVVQLIVESGQSVQGFDAWIESDIPLGGAVE